MMDSGLLKEGERIDDLQRNGYRIIQDPEKFCFGMDAVLLAGFARLTPDDRVLDLGTGTGVLPILLSARYGGAHFTGLEIQEEMAEMAGRSVRLNSLEDRIDIVCGDIKDAAGRFGAASYTAVVSNPPYMNESHGLKNPEAAKAIARHEILCTLEDVVRAAAACLQPGGRFFMVHRPHRLPEIIESLRAARLEPKRLRMVHPYADAEARMVLIESVRGGGAWLKVEQPLVIYREPGVYTEEVYRIYGD